MHYRQSRARIHSRRAHYRLRDRIFEVCAKMSRVKCNSCNIVIDELLSFIQNKISIADEESLVKICSSFFTGEQIEKSQKLLFEAVTPEMRRKVRKGKGKENRVLFDIIGFFKATEPDMLPVFVARDLEKLPPITFDHLDVSKILKDLVLVQAEIKALKSSYVTVDQLEKFKNECLQNNYTSPPFSAVKVNVRRGAYCDSGPMGLSNLDDSILQNTSSQSAYLSPLRTTDVFVHKSCTNKQEGMLTTGGTVSDTVVECASSDDAPPLTDSTSRRFTSPLQSPRPLSPVGTDQPITVASPSGTTDMCENKANTVALDGGWTEVQKRKSKPKYRYRGQMGTMSGEEHGTFRAAERKSPIFITNIHMDTDTS
jgi:hypothetical protein